MNAETSPPGEGRSAAAAEPPKADPPPGAGKIAPPPLNARAPRPPAIRLRRSVALGVGLGAAGLIAGALTWSFVVHPELRLRARAAAAETRPEDAMAAAKPTEAVTAQPATYDRLPPPRRLGVGGAPSPDAATLRPPRPTPRPATRPRAEAPEDMARPSGLFFAGAAARPHAGPPPASPNPTPRPATSSVAPDDAATANPHRLTTPRSPFELKAGAVIPASLLTAIDTARPGPVVAVITANLFDTVTGQVLLAPQGTRLIGHHEGASRYGDRRAFLTWDRLILPNGKSLVLTGAPGVDPQGAMGVRGRVDRRLGPLALASLFAGAITTLGQVARDGDDRGGGLLGDAGDAAAIEAAQVGGRLVDRELDVAPSIRLDPGAQVRVLVTRDLVLEPYRP